MSFKRGDDDNRRNSRWVVGLPHDPDRSQVSDPTSSGPASNPPAQYFHCGLASCGIEFISTTTGRPLPGVSICTRCCGVVWCAACLIVVSIECSPHPIKYTQCGQSLTDSRLVQSTTASREHRALQSRHPGRGRSTDIHGALLRRRSTSVAVT